MRRGTPGWRAIVCCALAAASIVARPGRLSAYSALTHEAIIDAAWDGSIEPALRARFHPAPDELKRARAFAYGGSLIQDIGYYPFSSRFFGNLTHYVRSGDFVEAMVKEATDLTEYAFALGALAHYAADNTGHPLAVNRAVPILYPQLRERFGNVVTYEQSPSAHLKTEFGFDVVQVARGKYASGAYHDFIGFEVSKPVTVAMVSCPRCGPNSASAVTSAPFDSSEPSNPNKTSRPSAGARGATDRSWFELDDDARDRADANMTGITSGPSTAPDTIHAIGV